MAEIVNAEAITEKASSKKQTKAVEKPVEKNSAKHSKTALLNSKRFTANKDLLSVLLEDGETYTVQEAAAKIKSYLEGGVK